MSIFYRSIRYKNHKAQKRCKNRSDPHCKDLKQTIIVWTGIVFR